MDCQDKTSTHAANCNSCTRDSVCHQTSKPKHPNSSSGLIQSIHPSIHHLILARRGEAKKGHSYVPSIVMSTVGRGVGSSTSIIPKRRSAIRKRRRKLC
jgi:hypothetical protein